VIADAKQPLALAGIMGGEAPAVSESSSDILLESAFFSPTSIIGKARLYGLLTNTTTLFERCADSELLCKAMVRATSLLVDIAGGQPGPIVEVANEAKIEQRPEISLRAERVNRLLGVEVSNEEIVDILTRLEMQVEPAEAGWRVKAPTCRFDISIEEDLIEEIGRIYGYARIPTNRGLSGMDMRSKPEASYDLHRAKQLLVDRDYQEVITYSFVSPEMQALIDPGIKGVSLANPISADMSIMRTSLWPGLLQTAQYNQSRQQGRVRIFESGLRFRDEAEGISQKMMLAGLITGDAMPEQWNGKCGVVDFFELKGDLEAVLSLTGNGDGATFTAAEHPALHPGQTAIVEYQGEQIGWIGMLHPELENRLDLAGTSYLFEIELERIEEGLLPEFEPLSKFPSIRRDIALVVEESVNFETVKRCIEKEAPQIIKDIRLFDVYTGENVDSGRKSLALGLILQEKSHTLTDEEVEGVVNAVLQRLADELKAKLRD